MSNATPLQLTGELTIGEIFTAYPATRSVIEKYFHGGCHHCPSQHTEPLWLAAKMYAVDLEKLLNEFKEVILQGDGNAATYQETAGELTPTERRLARDRARGLIY